MHVNAELNSRVVIIAMALFHHMQIFRKYGKDLFLKTSPSNKMETQCRKELPKSA